ncbi:hypothetical protein Slu03_07490 [Sediminihabitans luteus]|nr:hypothetical protein Slu03_07490 [Sediminihabitans luteus]
MRNIGGSVAREIAVEFDPGLTPVLPTQSLRPFIIRRYERRIANLGPGQELTNAISADLSDQSNSDLPLDLTVTISYRRGRVRRYKDRFRLDTSLYAQHTYATSDNSILGRLSQIRKELRHLNGADRSANYFRGMRDDLESIAKSLQALSGPGEGRTDDPADVP